MSLYIMVNRNSGKPKVCKLTRRQLYLMRGSIDHLFDFFGPFETERQARMEELGKEEWRKHRHGRSRNTFEAAKRSGARY